jgi:hypothetical protein
MIGPATFVVTLEPRSGELFVSSAKILIRPPSSGPGGKPGLIATSVYAVAPESVLTITILPNFLAITWGRSEVVSVLFIAASTAGLPIDDLGRRKIDEQLQIAPLFKGHLTAVKPKRKKSQ